VSRPMQTIVTMSRKIITSLLHIETRTAVY